MASTAKRNSRSFNNCQSTSPFGEFCRAWPHEATQFCFMNVKNSTKKPVSGLAFFVSALCIAWMAWPEHIGALPDLQPDSTYKMEGQPKYNSRFPQGPYDYKPRPQHRKQGYSHRSYSEPRFSTAPAIVIDINEADSLDWVQIPGIGPKTARRIVASRNKLHGFYSVNQLLDVYYFDSNLLQSNRVQFQVKPQSWQGMNWDSIRSKQDLFHPYLSASQRHSLWAYKNQHPEFDPRKSPKPLCIDSITWMKLKPYWM